MFLLMQLAIQFGYLNEAKKEERGGRREEGVSTYARIFDGLVLVSLHVEDSVVSP